MAANTTNPPSLSRFEGVAAVLLTLLGWSSVPLFLKHFSHSIDAWTSNGWRYGFSALLWAPVLIAGALRSTLPAGLWKRALVPSLINAMGQICFTWAHYKIDPGLLTFGLRMQIVFVALGALILFPTERKIIRSTGFIIGMSLVMGGTMATVLLAEGGLAGATGLGITLAILSGLFFAAYALSVRYYMQGVRPLVAFSAISQYTAAAMVALMLMFGDNFGLTALDLSAPQFALLLLSAFIGIALGHVCYYTAIAKLGVAVSSGIIQLQPFFVSLGSLMLFSERLTPIQWITGCIAVSGAGLVLYVQHRMKQAERRAAALVPLASPTATTAERIREYDELPADHVAAASAAESHSQTTRS